MNLLDNIDEQLHKSKEIQEIAYTFKHTKIKHLKEKKETRKGYFERKNKIKSDKKFKRKSIRISKRKYKRCPKKYDAYIKSHWWTKRKNKYYQNHGRRCEICGSAKFIVLHHMVYGEFGNEKDEHLMPLCKSHHEGYHIEYGVSGNMLEQTWSYVEKEQIKLNQGI